MKLRVLFLKKVHILYGILFILFCMIIFSLYHNKNTQTFTFTINNIKKSIEYDFTGDGEPDLLSINTDNNDENAKYHLEVTSKNKVFPLAPNNKLNTLGSYYSYYPMRLIIQDITRDKIPEIFTQSCSKGTSIQHIFIWNEEKFKDIFFSTNNILGILDSSNNKTPKFISGTLLSNKINFSSYMYINNKIEKIKNVEEFPGETEVLSFINYIHSFPYGEPYRPDDVFHPKLSQNSWNTISKLSDDNKIYTFTNASFSDSNFDKNGNPSQFKWLIYFKSTDISDNTKEDFIALTIKLKKDTSSDNNYRIYSISKTTN